MYRQSGKNLLNNNTSSTCPDNMVNFGLLTGEICWQVWGTPANFNGFHILAALLHGTPVVGVSQTLRRWTEGASYIRQGGHHVGHYAHILFFFQIIFIIFIQTGMSGLVALWLVAKSRWNVWGDRVLYSWTTRVKAGRGKIQKATSPPYQLWFSRIR